MKHDQNCICTYCVSRNTPTEERLRSLRDEGERVRSPSAISAQVAGEHYRNMAIQPVEFIYKNGLGFCEGSAIAYICRHRQKNKAEDIKKAIHFLQLLLELEYGE